jgi:hypothetical protein
VTKPPSSRWRTQPSSGGRGAADRVRLSQAQARRTVRFALCFIVAAALAAMFGPTVWLPLHLFLAGAVVLGISGVSLMLTVTWSAAPAPPDRWVGLQRICIAAGAAGIAVGRSAALPVATVAVAGTVYLTGVVLLAVLLVTTVRRGVERRFDVAVAAYVAALAAGTAGAVVGVVMAVGSPSPALRSAHATLTCWASSVWSWPEPCRSSRPPWYAPACPRGRVRGGWSSCWAGRSACSR